MLSVHELDEQECLTYFDVLRLAIQLMLDQKVEEDLKQQRDKIVKQQLAEIEIRLKDQIKGSGDIEGVVDAA